MSRVVLFLRAFLIVCCTAANVVLIARGHWLGMALSGFAISGLWWWNVKSSAHSRDWCDGLAYSTGAMCGTLAGAVLGRWL